MSMDDADFGDDDFGDGDPDFDDDDDFGDDDDAFLDDGADDGWGDVVEDDGFTIQHDPEALERAKKVLYKRASFLFSKSPCFYPSHPSLRRKPKQKRIRNFRMQSGRMFIAVIFIQFIAPSPMLKVM